MQKLIEKIIEHIYVFILFAGMLFILIGASKGINSSSFTLSVDEIEWRIGISLMGTIFVAISLYTLFNNEKSKNKIIENKNKLTAWDDNEFFERLKTAQDICMISISNYDMLTGVLSENLRDFLRNGGKYRCIYLDPESDSLSMVSQRSIDVESDINHLKNQYSMTIDSVRKLSEISKRRNDVQARLTDYLSGYVLTILDAKLPEGVAYITLNGYGLHYTKRPSLIISKSNDPIAFEFFEDTFDNLWDASEKNKIEL